MKTKQNIKQTQRPINALGVTHADRKRWWTNYNASLVNRISEIKKAQS
jgi:hypothetical protein